MNQAGHGVAILRGSAHTRANRPQPRRSDARQHWRIRARWTPPSVRTPHSQTHNPLQCMQVWGVAENSGYFMRSCLGCLWPWEIGLEIVRFAFGTWTTCLYRPALKILARIQLGLSNDGRPDLCGGGRNMQGACADRAHGHPRRTRPKPSTVRPGDIRNHQPYTLRLEI